MRRILICLALLLTFIQNAWAVSAPVVYVPTLSTSALGFLATGTGNIAPVVNLTGAATNLGSSRGVAVDGSGNLWVADNTGPSIRMYAAGSTGNTPPSVTITGGNTVMSGPRGMGFCPTSGDLWVADFGGGHLLRWSAAHLVTGGNIAPDSNISGGSTTVGNPNDVACDGTGNIYAVPDAGHIIEFAVGSTGNIAPTNTITSAGTEPTGIAVTSAGKIYETSNASNINIWNAGNFGTHDAQITGASTGLASAYSVALDSTGKIYVYDSAHILVYASGATGNATPTGNITGASTGLSGVNPLDIAIWPVAIATGPTGFFLPGD